MPSTHLSLHYHLIFSTKERCPFISPEWRGRLHAFLGGEVRTLNGFPTPIKRNIWNFSISVESNMTSGICGECFSRAPFGALRLMRALPVVPSCSTTG